ncbi:MAG: thiamine pyrophosphate-dependent enzyme [Thermoplasmataceae archaeon]
MSGKSRMLDSETIGRITGMLESSSNPMIVTWRSGRHLEWYNALTAFANRYGIPVINYAGEFVNYPADGPMALDHLDLRDADLILVLEDDVPWIPSRFKPGCDVIRVDADPDFLNIPYYGIDATLKIRADIADFLDRINPNISREKVEDRRSRLSEMHASELKSKREEIMRLSRSSKIHPRYLSYEIGRLGAVMFTEYQIDPRYAMPLSFGSYFSTPSAGYLGIAMGSALGYRIATGKDVVAGVGDGAFYFGVPSAFGYAAKDNPILCAIYDNGGWLASAIAVDDVFPEGVAKKTGTYPGASLKRYPIGKIIETFGGSYRLIEDPSDVGEALHDGMGIIRDEGRPVVLQFIVERER